MKKFTIYNLQFTIYFIAIITLLLVGLFFYKDALAACDPGSSPPRAELLVTSPTLSGKFFTSGKVCIVNVSGSIIAFDISAAPNYDNLKDEFYTKSKKTKNDASSSLSIQNENLYSSSGDLSISSVSGSGIALVFVDGNLEIAQNILYGKGSATSGVVFIVKGNVFIREAVTEFNGVIISEGRILTAASLNSVCNPNTLHQTLTVNGSLISINSSSPINFCRKKADTRTPAEVINHQAKYLVLLKNIFFDTIQQWSEIVELPNLSVVAIPIPPTVDLKVAPPIGPATDGPITINSGQSATLSWATSNTPNNIPQNCIASASPSSATWTGLKSIPGGSETTGPLSGPNTYTYNLKCSNTAGEFTDTVTVNVNPPFDYSLTASSNITVLQGQGGSNTISLNYIAGPAAAVTLTSSISPAAAGVNISLTPPSCTPTCSSALAVTTATTTPAATYTVTITGNGGGITRSTSFTLRVNAPPPTVTTLAATNVLFSSATLNASVNPNGLATTGWYKWNTSQAGSCASWPNTSPSVSLGSGTTATPNPISVSGLSPNITYSFCAGAQSSAGTVYGNKLQFTTPNAPPFDYSLTNSGNITLTQGQSGSNSITRTLTSGSTQSVTLSASGLPSGASASFTSNPCNPTCSSTLTISTSTSTPAGSYTITVTGPATQSGNKSTSFTLTVNSSCQNGYQDFDFDNVGGGGSGCWVPSSSYQVVSTGGDCNDSNNYIYQNVNVSQDADHDGYSTTTSTSSVCVGIPQTINGRTYFRGNATSWPWWNSASSIRDCDDNNSSITACPPLFNFSVPACFDSGADITISWNPTVYPNATWIDMSQDANFSWWFNKNITGLTSTTADNFIAYLCGACPTDTWPYLNIKSNSTYYVRLWNESFLSETGTFSTPGQCRNNE